MDFVRILGTSLGLLPSKEPWRCSRGRRNLDGKALGAQCNALRSATVSNVEKIQCLQHVRDLASKNPVVQLALCNSKVLHAVFGVFLSSPDAAVKEAAKSALEALCQRSRDNIVAVLGLSHMVLFQNAQFRTAMLETTGLLKHLADVEPVFSLALIHHFQQPNRVRELLLGMRHWSRLAREQPSFSNVYMDMLEVTLGMLQSAASIGGTSMCRELFDAGVMELILGLLGLQVRTSVARGSLALLGFLLAQVPAHRAQLEEKGGVQVLLAMLADSVLPCVVRQEAADVLRVACSSSRVAMVIKAQSLDILFSLLGSYLGCQKVLGMPGSGLACTSGAAAAASFHRTSAGGLEPEPLTAVFVERLLRLLDAVVAASHGSPELLEDQRLQVLLDLLSLGLKKFEEEDYLVAIAAAQVLFRLFSNPNTVLDSEMCSDDVINPLYMLVVLALQHATVTCTRDARILHGGFCAMGALCKVFGFKYGSGGVKEDLLLDGKLRFLVDLINMSATAILVAVGASQPPCATLLSDELSFTTKVHVDGYVYLLRQAVASDIQVAVQLILKLLWTVMQQPLNIQVFKAVGLAEVLTKFKDWKKVQFIVTMLLNKLGVPDSDYKPFRIYDGGRQLVAVLNILGLESQTFVENGVIPADLLRLEDTTLLQKFGLDKSGILKVANLREAHSVFTAVDKDVNGCITQSDLHQFLVNDCNQRMEAAKTCSEKLFKKMQVEPGEPANFLQFLEAYPSMQAELGLENLRLSQDRATGPARDNTMGHFPKRQRVS